MIVAVNQWYQLAGEGLQPGCSGQDWSGQYRGRDIEFPTAMDWTRQKDGQLPPSSPTTVWRTRPGLASTGSPKEAV